MTDKKGWLGPYPPNSRHADKVTIDEIVRLRAENEQLRETLRLMPKTIADAADEIERLRNKNKTMALDHIASEGEWCDLIGEKYDEIKRLRDALSDVNKGINQWLHDGSPIKRALLKLIDDALEKGE